MLLYWKVSGGQHSQADRRWRPVESRLQRAAPEHAQHSPEEGIIFIYLVATLIPFSLKLNLCASWAYKGIRHPVTTPLYNLRPSSGHVWHLVHRGRVVGVGLGEGVLGVEWGLGIFL